MQRYISAMAAILLVGLIGCSSKKDTVADNSAAINQAPAPTAPAPTNVAQNDTGNLGAASSGRAR
jgi:hypothetical protein